MSTTIIGLGCTARIGKDYAAQELARHWSVERVAFADELKRDLAATISKSGLDYFKMEKNEADKVKLRPLLVSYGQTMREFEEDIWIRRAFQGREFNAELTVITDVRFPNEVNWLKSVGGVYIDVQTNVPPANLVEAQYRRDMYKLADYRVTNNFNSKYMTDMVDLVDDLIETSKGKTSTDILWTQSSKSVFTPSTEENISSYIPTLNA